MTKITHPETGRKVSVHTFRVVPRDVLAGFKSGAYQSYRDLGLALLGQRTATIEREQGGDSARSNLGLSAFENALDWSLGIAAMRFIQAAVAVRKLPKPFDLAVTRGGAVFTVTANGRVIA